MIDTLQKNVTTPLTAVALGTAEVRAGLATIIKAKQGNTGTIGVGATAAKSLLNGTSYFSLEAGQAITVRIASLGEVFIDASVAGEGVEVLYEPII